MISKNDISLIIHRIFNQQEGEYLREEKIIVELNDIKLDDKSLIGYKELEIELLNQLKKTINHFCVTPLVCSGVIEIENQSVPTINEISVLY